METYDLDVLRSLPQCERQTAGVYFLWNGDELLYVGQSKNIHNRLVRHNPEKIPFTRHTCIAIEYMTDGWKNIPLERAYIVRYNPPHNIMHTPAWKASIVCSYETR